MYNIILDKLPTDYNGFLIRTSFRIGIQICLCLKDEEFTDEEKTLVALNLLYGNGVPDIDTAIDGLNWFLSCGNPSKNNPPSASKELFYWDFDSARLYSSFKNTYGIDLTRQDMHWFEFIALIGSLDKNTSFSKAVEIRSYDPSDMKGKARVELMKMKKELTPAVEYSAEEQDKIDEFMNLLNGGDING